MGKIVLTIPLSPIDVLLFVLFVVFFCLFVVCCLLQRKHERLGAYNLDEEEELTHYGQSLGDMERFDDIQLSEEEVEEGVCVCVCVCGKGARRYARYVYGSFLQRTLVRPTLVAS